MRLLLKIFTVVFLMNWLLGILSVNHVLPAILFPILNFPFGLPHYWMSTHWRATGYDILGIHLSEDWDLVSWAAMVMLQSLLWWGLWRWLQPRKLTHTPAVS